MDSNNYSEYISLLQSKLSPYRLHHSLEVAKSAKYLAEKSHGGQRGARDLRNLIRKEIEDGIANIIIENAETVINAIAAEVKDGKIVLSSI